MHNGSVNTPQVSQLNIEQRRRLECMTAVKALFAAQYNANRDPLVGDLDDLLRATDYLVTGAF